MSAMTQDVDLFVIGGGSGGVRAARVAAEHGARVAIAEEDRYGGTCVLRGCVPKKLLTYAADFGHAFADARAYGWEISRPSFAWSRLLAAVSAETSRLSGLYQSALERLGVEVLHDRAVIARPGEVAVGGRRFTAGAILVATGSRPDLPAMPGIEHAMSSDGVFALDELPRRIAIAGGGYIAVEFAGIFAALGRELTVIHRGERVLGGFDEDVRAAATEDLRALGIDLRLEETVVAIEARSRGGPYRVALRSGDAVEVDGLVCATGRVPQTAGLGLEEAGVALRDNGAVVVDECSQTSAPGVYAVGDCTDRVNLTPVAIREGQAFADTVFGGMRTPIDHAHVPSAVFGRPPIGVVGLTEEEARRRHDVTVYRSRFRPLLHSLTGREERVRMKVIVDRATDRILGVHLVGKEAPEIIQVAAVLVRMGARKADLDATVAVHPTTAEELVLLRARHADAPLPSPRPGGDAWRSRC